MQSPKLDEISSLIWQRFYNAYTKNILPKALLLTNPFGLVNATLIKKLHALLLCQQQNAPCLTCKSCKLVFNDAHPDITLISPNEDNASIGIELIRNFQTNLYLTPQLGKRRIVYFASLDSLTLPASEALLKIIEEPPEAVFIIGKSATTVKLLPTLLSRFQRWVLPFPNNGRQNYLAPEFYAGKSATFLSIMEALPSLIADLHSLVEDKICATALAEKWSEYHLLSLIEVLYCLFAEMVKLHYATQTPGAQDLGEKPHYQLYCLSQQLSLWSLLQNLAILADLSKKLKMPIALNSVLQLENWLQQIPKTL